MKIVVDNKIPYIKGEIERLADEVVYLPGKEIGADDVKDADVLIVRTRTRCDAALLEGSSVGLVVTATIGYDHLDTQYLDSHGIRWANCPGCNANSVCRYVHNALVATDWLTPGLTIGVVGVGHVGTLVAEDCQRCGLRVLLCDPPRQDAGELVDGMPFVSLDTIMSESDIITFHTPLTREGKYATFHMADADFFRRLPRRPLIINASRGSVVDGHALLGALREGFIGGAVIDTWEGEPDIDRQLLAAVDIATPHIAGYSADGKANATRMSLQKVYDFIDEKASFEGGRSKFCDGRPVFSVVPPEGEKLSAETILSDSNLLKSSPETFERQREQYPVRRE